MASILERLEELEVKVKGLEAVREGLEWLGATVQGQTEALDVVTEELNKKFENFGQDVLKNHQARQEARRQQAIQQSKDNVAKMVASGSLVVQEVSGPGTIVVGTVTKGETVVHSYEVGFFENFPPALQEAIKDKGVGAAYDGPKGVFTVIEIYAANKQPKVVEGLSAEAPAPEAPTGLPEAPIVTVAGPNDEAAQ